MTDRPGHVTVIRLIPWKNGMSSHVEINDWSGGINYSISCIDGITHKTTMLIVDMVLYMEIIHA
jgi:hypothetical protein